MIINLVSTRANRNIISGPNKVYDNLVKGLEKIGQPYVVNRALNSTRYLWIHDNLSAVLEFSRCNVLSVLGPNLVVLPQQLPTRKPFPRATYLHPSQWVAGLWLQEGFSQCPLQAWPVGIDTEEFPARRERQLSAPVLIYYKQRDPHELEQLKRVLDRKDVPYEVLLYGHYTQKEYGDRLRKCSFAIWLGRQESQGIALQEALATDVPILVLDAHSLFDYHPSPERLFPERLRSIQTTVAPYFDSRCGIILDSMDDLEEGLASMYDKFHTFRPRDFVVENLSLEKQAKAFVGFFQALREHFGSEVAPSLGNRDEAYKPHFDTRLKLDYVQQIRSKVSGVLARLRGLKSQPHEQHEQR